ncbi:MAG: prepilin-type N-terminal cleavage/methylation domain-containing protein [Planctomycetota bacterium]
MPRRRPATAAFTLLEVLVTLLVIGVLAGMIVPAVGSGRDKAQVRDASQALWQAARFTQQRAVLRGVDHRLVLLMDGAEGGPGFRVEVVDHDAQSEDGYTRLTTGAFKPQTFARSVTFGTVRVSGQTPSVNGRVAIGFRAAGDADAAAVVLTSRSQDSAAAYSVLVAPNSGRVQRVDSWIDTPPNDREDLDV